MRRFTVMATVAMVALGALAGPAAAHPHRVVTPQGNCVNIPTEPTHIHTGDPTNGAIRNNPHHASEGSTWVDALHPIHHFLHWGAGKGKVEVHGGAC